ncbi:TNF receptor-associated factor4 [Porites harrisoni]
MDSVKLDHNKNHMESCLLLIVSCTNNNCTETMRRKDLDKHVTIGCQWRLVHCSYCNEPQPKCRGEEHIDVCKKYPVQCSAACGVEVPREKILEHTESNCPLITVSCPFAVMGCDVKILRNQIESHLQSSSSRHLELACVKLHNTQEEFREKTKELEGKMDSLCMLHDGRISTLENQLKEFKKVNDFLVDKVAAQAKQISALYIKLPQLSWRINDIEKILSQAREKRSTVLESSPFYSANHGYKLKLYVYPNGDVTNKHNYLSVFLVIMEGEYDSLLPWPFHQKITFILVDQPGGSDEKKNIVMELTTDPTLSSCAKPVAGKVGKPSNGFARFVTHKNLKTRRYIVNDSLLLQVEVHPPN